MQCSIFTVLPALPYKPTRQFGKKEQPCPFAVIHVRYCPGSGTRYPASVISHSATTQGALR